MNQRGSGEPRAHTGSLTGMRTTRWLHLGLFGLLATSLALSGCGASPDTASPATPTAPAGLAGRTFLSTGVTVDGEPMPLAQGTQLSITFDDERVSANAGCNTMSGDATVKDGALVVSGGLAMTEMGCDPDRMDQDQWFADLLTSSPTVQLSGSSLTLTSEATIVDMTDDEVVNPDQPLTGGLWILEAIADGDAVSSLPTGVKSTLRFEDNGEFTASPGCNSGGGQYTVEGDNITFGSMAMTAMGCPGDRSEVESTVVSVLQGDVTYAIDGSSLTLTNGGTALTYRMPN